MVVAVVFCLRRKADPYACFFTDTRLQRYITEANSAADTIATLSTTSFAPTTGYSSATMKHSLFALSLYTLLTHTSGPSPPANNPNDSLTNHATQTLTDPDNPISLHTKADMHSGTYVHIPSNTPVNSSSTPQEAPAPKPRDSNAPCSTNEDFGALAGFGPAEGKMRARCEALEVVWRG